MQAGDREKIGLHGLEVTRLGLGGTTFGNMYSALDDQEGLDVIDASYMAGVRYFDTAPLYGYGMSETKMGPGLARYNRDEIAISSKVGYVLKERQEGDDYVDLFVDAPKLTSYFDYSRDAVLRSIEGSLKRLKTDRLDVVLIHDPDDGKSIEPGWVPGDRANFDQVMAEAYPALAELREQGVVKAIGQGMNQWQMLADFARAGNFDAFLLAGRYTLLEQESLRELLPLCAEQQIGVISYSPLGAGFLTGKYHRNAEVPTGTRFDVIPGHQDIYFKDKYFDIVEGLRAKASELDRSMVELALAWTIGQPGITSVLIGARDIEQVDQAFAAEAAGLSDELRTELSYF